MALTGAAFGTGAFKLTGSPGLGFLVGGICGAAMDLYVRFQGQVDHPMIDPTVGGHVYLIPSWVQGVVAAGSGIAMLMGFL